MGFAGVLKLYLEKTKCTAKELSAASGISASALSRYRSGTRIPEQEQMEKLICGFVQLARENAPELDEAAIRDAFSEYTEKPTLDYQAIIHNLNTAIEALDISVSGLSRALRFDSSYLSRIRTGQRKPANLSRQRNMAETILKNGTICDAVSVLSEEAFEKEPVYLSLSGMFSEKGLRYTYQEYLRHLAATRQFAQAHAGYGLRTDAVQTFRNIQIQVNAGKWVIVSKDNAPSIHFVIKHPKMIRAFEDFCRPAAEP